MVLIALGFATLAITLAVGINHPAGPLGFASGIPAALGFVLSGWGLAVAISPAVKKMAKPFRRMIAAMRYEYVRTSYRPVKFIMGVAWPFVFVFASTMVALQGIYASLYPETALTPSIGSRNYVLLITLVPLACTLVMVAYLWLSKRRYAKEICRQLSVSALGQVKGLIPLNDPERNQKWRSDNDRLLKQFIATVPKNDYRTRFMLKCLGLYDGKI
jgi:hypothetical protein